MKRFFVLACCLYALLYTSGQTKLSPYTKKFLDKSEVVKKTAVANPQQGISAFVHISDVSVIEELISVGVNVRSVAGDLITCLIPADIINKVQQLSGVKYIQLATGVNKTMDEAKISANVNKIIEGNELPADFNGEGVIIGIIDNGVDYGHVNFWDSNKETLRISRVWDQNRTGTPPQGYDYGEELDSQEEILAAVSDNVDETHGTHVTGIAAGSDNTGNHNYSGVAPGAEIVFVSLNSNDMVEGDNTTVIDGINYIFNYAEAQNKPCVINMSLGSFLGPRDGSSAFDQMADELQGPGRLLVGSVGNDGSSRAHLSRHFEAGERDTLKTFFDYIYTYPRVMCLEVWGDEGMEFSFTPIVYNTVDRMVISEGETLTVSPQSVQDRKYVFTSEKDGATGNVDVYSELNPFNNKLHLYVDVNFYMNENICSGFYITSESQGTVHVWSDNIYGRFGSMGMDGFEDGNDESTMGEIGGSGKRIISVGAYTTRNHSKNMGIVYPSGEKLGELASFSSYGPTPDGRIKPEITAPGTYIISSLSSVYDGSKRVEERVEWNGQKYPFGYMQGTSMASPFVAGVLAVWLQAFPEMTPEQAKEIIAGTAVRDEFAGHTEGYDHKWGAGKLDAWNGLKECIKTASSIGSVSSELKSAVIWKSQDNISILFSENMNNVDVLVYDLQGRMVDSIHYTDVNAGDEFSFGANYVKGIYIIKMLDDNHFVKSQKIIL